MTGRRGSGLASILASAVTAAILLAGCSSADSNPDPADPTSAAGTPSAKPTPATHGNPGRPRAGSCYRLGVAAAARPTNDARPVPCAKRHTSVTISVGTLDLLRDGHLLTVDSASVQAQVASSCRRTFAAHVRGTADARRLSLAQPIWFTPTLAQSDRGARWFRCDLVVIAGPDQLADLPRRTAGLLASEATRNRYATCGTQAPSGDGFDRVICGRKHSWRVRASINLPRNARYLARPVTADADARCRDVDARIARNPLRLRWAFEWPTRQQWEAGQRYGYCWTPDPA